MQLCAASACCFAVAFKTIVTKAQDLSAGEIKAFCLRVAPTVELAARRGGRRGLICLRGGRRLGSCSVCRRGRSGRCSAGFSLCPRHPRLLRRLFIDAISAIDVPDHVKVVAICNVGAAPFEVRFHKFVWHSCFGIHLAVEAVWEHLAVDAAVSFVRVRELAQANLAPLALCNCGGGGGGGGRSCGVPFTVAGLGAFWDDVVMLRSL